MLKVDRKIRWSLCNERRLIFVLGTDTSSLEDSMGGVWIHQNTVKRHDACTSERDSIPQLDSVSTTPPTISTSAGGLSCSCPPCWPRLKSPAEIGCSMSPPDPAKPRWVPSSRSNPRAW